MMADGLFSIVSLGNIDYWLANQSNKLSINSIQFQKLMNQTSLPEMKIDELMKLN